MGSKMSESQTVNRMVAINYIFFAIVSILAYVIEIFKGARKPSYIVVLLVFVLIPIIIDVAVTKIYPTKDMTRYILPIGFMFYYAYLLFTTTTIMSFSYIIPMLVIFPIFHNFKYTLIYNSVALIINILYATIQLTVEGKATDPMYITDVEIQILVILLVNIYGVLTSRIDEEMTGRKLRKIEEEQRTTQSMLDSIHQVAIDAEKKVVFINDQTNGLREASIASADAMGQVCDGTNSTAESLQDEIVQINNMGNEMDSISKAVELFCKNIEETLQVIEKGNSNMKKLKSSAQETMRTSAITTSSMSQLSEQINNINAIMRIIDGVSAQTNLLSLNASIEAARAGDTGRGFAVVAEEIRSLSEETKDSLSLIRNEISSIMSNTGEVSEKMINLNEIFRSQNTLVDDTGHVLSDIATASEALGEECVTIIGAVEKMQKSRNVIVDSVTNISAISQQVTANAQSTENMNRVNLEKIQVLNTNVMELVEMIKRLN